MKRISTNRSEDNLRPSFRAVSTLSIAFLTILLALPLLAQQQSQPQPQQPVTAPGKIASQTNIVTVTATVRDKKNEIVSNLTKEDFTLDEDGRPETITYFARENDLPLTVGLLVDTSMSQRRLIGSERDASSTFIDHTLREDKKDQAFLIHFDREVELLQDLTTSRQKLDSALKLLQTPQMEDASDTSGDGGGGNGGEHHHAGGTLLYDAVFLASDEMMKKQQGRKALVVLSDGVDRGSKETLLSSIESAQRANTVIYSILFKDEQGYGGGQQGGHHGGRGMGGPGGYPGGGYPGGGGGGGGRRNPQREERPDGKKILDRMSKETGGRLFEVNKKQSVDQIYDAIQQELRDQYILGYVPDKSVDSSDYHKIHLTTKQKDLTVQARDGYYAEQQPPTPAPTPAAAPAKPASGN